MRYFTNQSKKILFGIFLLSSIFFVYNASAYERGLSDVSYVTRAQWGADESLKNYNRAEYAPILAAQEKASTKAPTTADKQRKIAQDFVMAHYASYFTIGSRINTENGKTLFWPFQYVHKSQIVVHHTADNGRLPQTIEEEKSYMQQLYKYHAVTRGRGDIGYNFLIMPSGRIYEGRAGGANVMGAHVTRNNYRSIGISLVGNFENIQVPEAQFQSLITLSTSIAKKYSINPTEKSYYFKPTTTSPYISALTNYNIIGHRDAGATACPGENLYQKLPTLREEVVRRLKQVSSGGSSTPVKQPSPTTPSTPISTPVQTDKTINSILSSIKDSYMKTNNIALSKAVINRMSYAPAVSQISTLKSMLIRVLLYEASELKSWDLTCDTACKVRINGKMLIVKSLSVASVGQGFVVTVDGKTYRTSMFAVTEAGDGGVAITNYKRGSSVNLNIFRQSLLFVYGPFRDIDGKDSKKQQVINIVSLPNYMRGIAEASDSEPQAKADILALLSKGYALYYLGGTVKHPNIPANGYYTAIDDPRMFQKYVGMGWESISKKWPIAIDHTLNQYITYDNKLPILPYFHCSAGFTWSGKEKRGWIDTPYLTSVSDPLGSCEASSDGKVLFQGHGVGLTGKGAAAMIAQGSSVSEVISYYYPGTKIQEIR